LNLFPESDSKSLHFFVIFLLSGEKDLGLDLDGGEGEQGVAVSATQVPLPASGLVGEWQVHGTWIPCFRHFGAKAS
jgi:hypothetical protein